MPTSWDPLRWLSHEDAFTGHHSGNMCIIAIRNLSQQCTMTYRPKKYPAIQWNTKWRRASAASRRYFEQRLASCTAQSLNGRTMFLKSNINTPAGLSYINMSALQWDLVDHRLLTLHMFLCSIAHTCPFLATLDLGAEGNKLDGRRHNQELHAYRWRVLGFSLWRRRVGYTRVDPGDAVFLA